MKTSTTLRTVTSGQIQDDIGGDCNVAETEDPSVGLLLQQLLPVGNPLLELWGIVQLAMELIVNPAMLQEFQTSWPNGYAVMAVYEV